jgi:hypothetical protein
LDAGDVAQRSQRLLITIDRDDLCAACCEKTRVPTCPGGNVENACAWRNESRKARDPRGRLQDRIVPG